MISNSEIKKIRSLSDKKFRDKLGLFAVEGRKMVAEAEASSFTVEKIYTAESVGEEAMARISQFTTPSPSLAIVRKPRDIVAEDARPGNGLYLALDSIRDPGNLGTIIRIADWFGLAGIYASHDTVDIFNPKTVQATMGAIFRVKFQYTDIPALCRNVRTLGGEVYGTFLDGSDIYRSTLRTGESEPCLIVIGNEANGISVAVESETTGRLLIPSFPPGSRRSESLNAAIATAVTVAEFRRRTR